MVPVENCTGCSACRDRCPQQAIEMREDREGFLYPTIDESKCNQCGLCAEICPVRTTVPVEGIDEPAVYAAWTTDREVLRRSSSGGVFSEIARVVLNKGGVVIGAAYDENMVVRQVGVETWECLDKLRGSKYVQSDVADSYRIAKKYLDAGRHVLYSGTPCQIAGLHAALGSSHETLLTCSLICHGAPSPKVFRMYLAYLARQYHAKVTGFCFRDKRYGWGHPTVSIKMSNGLTVDNSNFDDPYNMGFLKNIYLRPACHACPYKTGQPVADITIGDFWELFKHQPELVNHGGTSAIIVNTTKGERVLKNAACTLSMTECSFAYLRNDSNLRKCVRSHPSRAAFFADLDRLSFGELARKYMRPRSTAIRVLARFRRCCLSMISRVKRR